MRHHIVLLGLAAFVAACDTTASTDTDDVTTDTDVSSGYVLCEGANCTNSPDCPADEPSDGDACTFSGNCHYCPGTDQTEARGYTCDGTSFTDQGTFDCST